MKVHLKERVKRLPPARRLLRSTTWQRVRHGIAMRRESRPDRTFTRFLRTPSQYVALCGPVVAFLDAEGKLDHLRITVAGCANGAEPYTIASVLRHERADLDSTIVAFDAQASMVERARTGLYDRDEIWTDHPIDEGFVAWTFEVEGGRFRVRPEIADGVRLEVADLNDPTLSERLGKADVVFAQNLLLNKKRAVVPRMFGRIGCLAKPRAVFFLDGMDLDLRVRLTRRSGMRPLDFRIPEIHEEVRSIRASGWPWHYWGVEPLQPDRRDWKRRYATIFTREGTHPPA
jgi:hypothetical protein